MSHPRRLLRNRQIVVACLILACFAVVAILAPWWAPPDDPDHPGGTRVAGKSHSPIPRPPSDEALLGTTTGQVLTQSPQAVHFSSIT